MTGPAAKRQKERASFSSDEKLIRGCLKGDAESWALLIDKYKNLIYSIPIKLGMYQDAPDIFQSVCVELLADLPNLRDHRALPKWLIQTSYHKCLHHRRVGDRTTELESADAEKIADENPASPPDQMMAQLEQEQIVREAMAELSQRCGRMVQMLFFEFPARPYDAIAAELGLATGSIGFIRGRCLAQLKKQLEKKGFS